MIKNIISCVLRDCKMQNIQVVPFPVCYETVKRRETETDRQTDREGEEERIVPLCECCKASRHDTQGQSETECSLTRSHWPHPPIPSQCPGSRESL